MNMKTKYESELAALEKAFVEISEKVPDLKVNAAKMKGKVAAAWVIENPNKDRLYVVLSGLEAQQLDENADLIITFESDVGQFFQVEEASAKLFLEYNYNQLNLCRLGLTQDQRLVALARRWFEGLTTRDAFDLISEVWNVALSLKSQLKPKPLEMLRELCA